jgi:hypothetical protein
MMASRSEEAASSWVAAFSTVTPRELAAPGQGYASEWTGVPWSPRAYAAGAAGDHPGLPNPRTALGRLGVSAKLLALTALRTDRRPSDVH